MSPATLDLAVVGDIPEDAVEAARRQIEKVERYTDEPVNVIRLTLRRDVGGTAHNPRAFVADASVEVNGRVLHAHVAAEAADRAAREAADRIRRQLRRVVGRDVALRNEPRVIREALDGLPFAREDRPVGNLKPPELRRVVHRRTYTSVPLSTLEAVNELLDIDLEFLLFKHARTGEDVVVYRRDDGRIGLIHPPGSELADENDIVVPQESRYSQPIAFDQARAEMDVLNHRFLYFIDSADLRGKVIYLRHDGDYGIVDPE
jgi:ribosome-associated translation inhibitor RaiA